jgi:hypothetical protein
MIALGFLTAMCMFVATVCVWRIVTERLGLSGGESPGDGGRDPMDLPGDGMSPHDLFLSELLSATTAPCG